MIFHRFIFVFCFLGALWITASEADFDKMCESSGRGLTFQYRQRRIMNGAVTSSDASWKEDGGHYQLVIGNRNEGTPLLSYTNVYTPTHVDVIFPGRLIRRSTTEQYRSFSDYYVRMTSNHYGGYISYTTNLLGEDFQAFERTSQLPEMMVKNLFRVPFKQIILFDRRGLFRQIHNYTSSNTPISACILDEFRFATTPLHWISTNNLKIMSVASEREQSSEMANFVSEKMKSSQGFNWLSTILVSMVFFSVSLLAIKWVALARKK
jgi:hypothetical protein